MAISYSLLLKKTFSTLNRRFYCSMTNKVSTNIIYCRKKYFKKNIFQRGLVVGLYSTDNNEYKLTSFGEKFNSITAGKLLDQVKV